MDNNIEVKNLDSQEFENLCKEIAVDWANKNLKNGYKIFYRKYEPIDIVITERNPKIYLPGQIIAENSNTEYEHFIECKFYGENLGIDDLSKSYLLTLRYKPKSLVIATNVQLTDRAIEFANWLTSELNNFACSIWNPIQNNIVDSVNEQNGSLFLDRFVKPFEIKSWTFFEENTFYKTLVSNNKDSKIKRHLLIPNNKYLFEARIIINKKILSQKTNIKLLLQTSQDQEIIQSLDLGIGINNEILTTGYIENISFNEELEFTKAFLIIKNNLGEDIITLNDFPVLITMNKTFLLPDFRNGLAEKIYEDLNTQNTAILMLSGEGGVGKTYLAQQVCNIAKSASYHIAHTSLCSNNEPVFLREIVTLLIPEKLRSILSSPNNEEFTTEFLHVFLNCFEGDYNNAECVALKDFLTFNKWQETEPEQIISIISKIITYSSNRIILLLSDCHQISNVCSRVLKALITVLDTQKGLSQKLKIILEYRSTKEDVSQLWIEMNNWLMNNFSNLISNKRLLPLGVKDIETAIKQIIISSDNKSIVELVMSKTGGNPLYIKMLLQSLLEHNILIPHKSDISGYMLSNLMDLKNFIVELSSNVESILLKRIYYWHEKTLKENDTTIGCFFLGLMSLINIELPICFLAQLTRHREEDVELILLRFQRAGFLERRGESLFSFSHEYIASASNKWVDIQDNVDGKIISIINNCEVVDFNSAISKGRLEAYVYRKHNAIKSYNAALQYSGELFNKRYRCHKEIFELFMAGNIEDEYTNLYFSNLEKMVHIGEYFASSKELISFNKSGIDALTRVKTCDFEKNSFFRQYYHNLSHTSLKALEIGNYFEYAASSLLYCKSDLEYAQFLNRLVKCATFIGNTSVAYNATVLALQLQQRINPLDDIDLESVLLGELYYLYSIFGTQNNEIVSILKKCSATDRQLCHNLYVEILNELHNENFKNANYLIEQLNIIIHKGDFKSMRISLVYLEGLIELIDGKNYEKGATNLKRAYIESAWLSAMREELIIGNNLLIAYICINDLNQAQFLYQRLLFICDKIDNNAYHRDCDILFQKANHHFNRECLPSLPLSYLKILVDLPAKSPNICDIIFINMMKISEMYPLHFPKSKIFDQDYFINNLSNLPKNNIPILVPHLNINLYLLL